MAISFSRSSSNYFTSSGGITLPNADWCIAMALRVVDNTGTSRSHIFTCHTLPDNNNNPRVFVRLQNESNSSSPGKAVANLRDASNQVELVSASQATPGNWILGVLQRTGATKQLWIGSFGNVPTLQASSTGALGAITVAAGMPLEFGRENQSNYQFGGDIAFWAKGEFALTSGQMYALGRGIPPLQVTQRWDMFLPMLGPAATISAAVGERVWTRAGSPGMVACPFQVL